MEHGANFKTTTTPSQETHINMEKHGKFSVSLQSSHRLPNVYRCEMGVSWVQG